MRDIDSMIPTSYDEALARTRTTRHGGFTHLSPNTRLVRNDSAVFPNAIEVQLHGTPVVTFHRDGRITLLTGGWRTRTTQRRLNAALRSHGVSIYQHKGEWRVRLANHSDHAWFEGYTIYP